MVKDSSFLDSLIPEPPKKARAIDKRKQLIAMMNFFDSLPEEERNRINYADKPVSFYGLNY